MPIKFFNWGFRPGSWFLLCEPGMLSCNFERVEICSLHFSWPFRSPHRQALWPSAIFRRVLFLDNYWLEMRLRSDCRMCVMCWRVSRLLVSRAQVRLCCSSGLLPLTCSWASLIWWSCGGMQASRPQTRLGPWVIRPLLPISGLWMFWCCQVFLIKPSSLRLRIICTDWRHCSPRRIVPAWFCS